MENYKLKHKITGNTGRFIQEYKPTGKPLTTKIKMDDASIFFAPSSEFEKIFLRHQAE